MKGAPQYVGSSIPSSASPLGASEGNGAPLFVEPPFIPKPENCQVRIVTYGQYLTGKAERLSVPISRSSKIRNLPVPKIGLSSGSSAETYLPILSSLIVKLQQIG